MTQRDRQAPAGLSATVAPPAAGTVTAPPGPRPGLSPGLYRPRASLWEDAFHGASPDQQHELLSLARTQGFLYAHQLPRHADRASNGTRPPGADDARGLQLLSQLLQGQGTDLAPVRPDVMELTDRDLDEGQRDAVARAVSTPDLCLIQGLPGTGKSRVVAEIVRQTAARGDRTLLVASGAAAIDRVLELVASSDVLCALRTVGRDEQLDALPPAARAATLPERVRALREHALAEAVRARDRAERRCQHLRKEEASWPRLVDLARDHGRLTEEVAALEQRHHETAAEVEQEAHRDDAQAPAEGSNVGALSGALARVAAACREILARVEEARAGLSREQEERRREIAALTEQIEAIEPLAQAKQEHRWWTPRWWRATLGGDIGGRVAELQAVRDGAHAALAGLEQRAEALTREQLAAEEDARKQRQMLLDEETARRRADLDARLAALDARRAALLKEWSDACTVIEVEAVRPTDATPEAVMAARAAWRDQQQEDERRCTFARQWAAYLEESADNLSGRLPGFANLVAATVAGLPADEHFGDASASGGQFDLLIVDEAERVTEAELLRLARRAQRWVLVGEPGLQDRSPDANERGGASPQREKQGRRPPLARPPILHQRLSPFHRLWQTLHADPASLPYAWVREGDRLCCRLRQLAPEQRQWLESERVADFPEIELRILASPRVRPLLAEVVFPPSMPVARAKEYIYQELQELPVLAAARSLRWTEGAEGVALWLAEDMPAADNVVSLEDGVRERIEAAGDGRVPRTCRLEFERAAGWDHARAAEWVRARLNLCDRGRTVRLEVPHRMQPALAGVVADLLFPGDYRTSSAVPRGAGAADGPALEFVMVPPVPARRDPVSRGEADRRRGRTGAATRGTATAPLPKAGAGLEQDLAVARHGDRLPNELRANLPPRGLVNYLEAVAVVRKLEELAADPALRRADAPAVAVIALYPAQAVLIRLLVSRSPALTGLPVMVDVPGALRQREFPIVLVSLTRSHSHRAVSFGEDPALLGLALTRARTRLILFGDPGTLARRAQWEGVLDHLDEAAAAREAQVLEHLLQYLHGRGRLGRAFRLSEGGMA